MEEMLVTDEKKDEKKTIRKSPQKTIRVRACRDFLDDAGKLVLAGQEADVSFDLADMLLAPIEGPFDFSGFRAESCATRAKIVRAEKVVQH